MLELVKMMPEAETLTSMNFETGNLAPEDWNEDGVY